MLPLHSSTLMNWYLGSLGCRLGQNVIISSWVVDGFPIKLIDADLLTVESRARIASGAIIRCHMFLDGTLVLSPVVIHRESMVCYGAVVEPGASVGTRTLVSKQTVVHGGTEWQKHANSEPRTIPCSFTSNIVRIVAQAVVGTAFLFCIFGPAGLVFWGDVIGKDKSVVLDWKLWVIIYPLFLSGLCLYGAVITVARKVAGKSCVVNVASSLFVNMAQLWSLYESAASVIAKQFCDAFLIILNQYVTGTLLLVIVISLIEFFWNQFGLRKKAGTSNLDDMLPYSTWSEYGDRIGFLASLLLSSIALFTILLVALVRQDNEGMRRVQNTESFFYSSLRVHWPLLESIANCLLCGTFLQIGVFRCCGMSIGRDVCIANGVKFLRFSRVAMGMHRVSTMDHELQKMLLYSFCTCLYKCLWSSARLRGERCILGSLSSLTSKGGHLHHSGDEINGNPARPAGVFTRSILEKHVSFSSLTQRLRMRNINVAEIDEAVNSQDPQRKLSSLLHSSDAERQLLEHLVNLPMSALVEKLRHCGASQNAIDRIMTASGSPKKEAIGILIASPFFGEGDSIGSIGAMDDASDFTPVGSVDDAFDLDDVV